MSSKDLYIDHTTKRYVVWQGIVIISSTISSFEYMNIVAFKNFYHELGGTGPWLWFWEIIFAIDFFIKFFVDFEEKNITGNIV
jgi:hypothetical protein